MGKSPTFRSVKTLSPRPETPEPDDLKPTAGPVTRSRGRQTASVEPRPNLHSAAWQKEGDLHVESTAVSWNEAANAAGDVSMFPPRHPEHTSPRPRQRVRRRAREARKSDSAVSALVEEGAHEGSKENLGAGRGSVDGSGIDNRTTKGQHGEPGLQHELRDGLRYVDE